MNRKPLVSVKGTSKLPPRRKKVREGEKGREEKRGIQGEREGKSLT